MIYRPELAFLNLMFQSCEHHKLNFIHLHYGREAESLKPWHIKTKAVNMAGYHQGFVVWA